MPVVLQWIGLVAVVATAASGLGHLYFEITESPQVPLAIERHRIPEGAPAPPPDDEDWYNEPQGTTRPEIAPRPNRSIVTPTPLPAREDPPHLVADPIVVYRPVPVDHGPPPQIIQEATLVQGEQYESLVERLRARLGDLQGLADAAPLEQEPDDAELPSDSEPPVEEDVPSDSTGQVEPPRQPAPPDSVGGVAVSSLMWNGLSRPDPRRRAAGQSRSRLYARDLLLSHVRRIHR